MLMALMCWGNTPVPYLGPYHLKPGGSTYMEASYQLAIIIFQKPLIFVDSILSDQLVGFET